MKEEIILFIAVRNPHRPVTSATIGHWLKKILQKSGIDTSIFTAHSRLLEGLQHQKLVQQVSPSLIYLKQLTGVQHQCLQDFIIGQ